MLVMIFNCIEAFLVSVTLCKKTLPHCSVLVVFRNGFEREFINAIVFITIKNILQ